MAYSSGEITAPVSIYDIQKCFGLSKNDIGNLIANASINKWAKYKPVRLQSIDTVTGQWNASQNVWLAAATWWKADGKCGMTFDTFTSIGQLSNTTSFIYKLVNGLLPWTYQKPTGGATQPFRATDFAGYIHDAVPAVGELAGSGRTIYAPASGAGTRTLSLNYESPAPDGPNLTLADFAVGNVSLQDFYLAIVMIKGSTVIVASSTAKVGATGSAIIETQIGYSDLGTWQVIPFLSSVNINAYGPSQQGTYLSAGYDIVDTITIASDGSMYLIYAEAIWSNEQYTQVGLNVTIANTTSSSKYFTGVTIYIYETDENATSGDAPGSQNVGSFNYSTPFTVQANNTFTIPENIHNQLLDMDFCAYISNLTKRTGKAYWVKGVFNDGTYTSPNWEPVQEAFVPPV